MYKQLSFCIFSIVGQQSGNIKHEELSCTQPAFCAETQTNAEQTTISLFDTFLSPDTFVTSQGQDVAQ